MQDETPILRQNWPLREGDEARRELRRAVRPPTRPLAPTSLSRGRFGELPAEMGERFVRVGHAVDIFPAGHRGAFSFESGA